MKLPYDLKLYLKNHLTFIATVDSAGKPDVIPKTNIAVLDEDHLILSDLRSPQTRLNIARNPQVALTVVNPFMGEGYQLKGRAEIIGSEPLADREEMRPGYAMNIRIEDVAPVRLGELAPCC